MRQSGAMLKLVAESGAAKVRGEPDTERPRQAPEGPARQARRELLSDWMATHTRVLGLWLDRLLEEGDDADLISMIHRQHAWLCMMQARSERG
ncbi:MAG: hypothetical protein KDA53_00050 [Hyphomonas sp.]|nr:hypothetical protein [Hyphomonas sp.]